MEINTGIPEEERKKVAEGLSRLLADSYTLYLKTHNFHWNVTGPMFQSLHAMFELHYTELATAVDEIAERIRALGEPAPGSYAAFARLSTISEAEGVPEASEMVRQLVEGHEAVAKTARAVLPIAGEGKDEVTIGLLADRLAVHEKTAWMLRSMIA
jgi:starvation-inducible DNA-binding protein